MAAPRAQFLVFVDTDCHVIGELASRKDVSADATTDTLRIDLLDPSANNAPYDLNTFVVADPSTWPLSFGVTRPSGGGDVLLRLRLFRAVFATSGTVLGRPTLEPLRQVTIDRLARLSSGSSGVERVRIVLSEDCLGAAPTLGSGGAPTTTCIDASNARADPRDGVDFLGKGPVPKTTVGTWMPAIEVPCESTPDSKRGVDGQCEFALDSEPICIKGGFAIIGDLNAVGGSSSWNHETFPLRPVIMSPFLLDQHEFTVGELRQLVASGAFTETPPIAYDLMDPTNKFCTWLGKDDPSNDSMPVNCIYQKAAEQACWLARGQRHGLLPTEAQWEYAARGRGQGRQYPWGDQPPGCCTVSAARGDATPADGECGTDLGPQVVGSHPVSASCGHGDVTRDCIFDMAGSLSEGLRSNFLGYADPSCWYSAPILHDPTCQNGVLEPVSRGGSWFGSRDSTLLALRGFRGLSPAIQFGFRCAYADGGS